MARRGSDPSMEGIRSSQDPFMSPWPAEEFLAGPDSQNLMEGARPEGRERDAMGTEVMGDEWIGPDSEPVSRRTPGGREFIAGAETVTDGRWRTGAGQGDIQGYHLETRPMTILGGIRVGRQYRYVRASAAAPVRAPRTPVTPAPRQRRPPIVVRPAIPGIAAAVTRPDPRDGEDDESQDSSHTGEDEIRTVSRCGPRGCGVGATDIISGRAEIISGGGQGPQARAALARPESARLTDEKRTLTRSSSVYGRDEVGGGAGPQARATLARPESARLADEKRTRTASQPVGGRDEVGYWTDLNRVDQQLDTPEWSEIGYGTPGATGAPTGSPYGSSSALSQYAQPAPQYAQPAPQYGGSTAPTGQAMRSLSSDSIDRLNSLNQMLQGLPDPSALAPMILTGLASGRYDAQRAFYHSKDYGEHWGKAMGVLWLASQMTGNEPMVQRMINEARDRLNDARSKLRDITGA